FSYLHSIRPYLFSPTCPRHHPALPSFPTRRSSDLNPDARLVQTEDLGFCHATLPLAAQAEFENHRRWATWDLLAGRVGPEHPLRSEEHTSELQSQSNLVCRLLLEKKKKYNIITKIQ